MKNNSLNALCLLTLLSGSAMAEVTNGSFENWSSGTPDSWSTIDSGISVSQEGSIVKSGSSAAAVTVNTGTQSSTDFRQSVSLVSGQTYNFSTWIYHTEGGVKARLYVNGYQGYSNESLVNQWQQISYTYTATATGNVEVGLRFYDVTGFDGSETVYVDDFEPASGDSGGGNGGSCANTQATLALTTDGYASETSWTLKTSSGSEVASNGTLANNTTYNETFCLADGDYTFTISDSYGDGICCNFGNGSYELSANGSTLASGASFTSSESTNFTIGAGGGDNGGGTNPDPGSYYDSITTQTGYTLKTALHNLINNHTTRGYSAIWTFYSSNALDTYYEKDGTILDIYSENPNGSDPYNFTKVSNQCGSYSGEGDCYNREHSFPRSWFGGDIEPMNSDIHHIFATDGKVNSVRSSYPYGEVASASYTSANGSKLGSASSSLGYSGTVFEPIDEFKGDIARAYFYMATRYEDQIASWQSISSYGDAVLNGTSTSVFEPWVISMLLSWHANDPVSQKEIDRNEAAYAHQGNRNPFVDHPEYVTKIWN